MFLAKIHRLTLGHDPSLLALNSLEFKQVRKWVLNKRGVKPEKPHFGSLER